MTDEVELPVVVIDAEQERRDALVGLVAPPEADDHAVRCLVLLHLLHGLARAGQVRHVEPLRDHAVEPSRLERAEPLLCRRGLTREGRQAKFLGAPLELATALLERLLPDGVAVPEQQVERNELGGDLCRQFADARLGGVQAQLHRIEVEPPVARNHDLAVECGVGRKQVAERAQLREVAKQRPAVARPERELAAVVLEHAAKSVPLRLVLPGVPAWQLVYELCFHRRKRHVLSRLSQSCRPLIGRRLGGAASRRRAAHAAERTSEL